MTTLTLPDYPAHVSNEVLLYEFESALGRNSRDEIPIVRAAVLFRMRAQNIHLCDPARVAIWYTSDPRLPADQAFTAGPDRIMAQMLEDAERRGAATVRPQPTKQTLTSVTVVIPGPPPPPFSVSGTKGFKAP